MSLYDEEYLRGVALFTFPVFLITAYIILKITEVALPLFQELSPTAGIVLQSNFGLVKLFDNMLFFMFFGFLLLSIFLALIVEYNIFLFAISFVVQIIIGFITVIYAKILENIFNMEVFTSVLNYLPKVVFIANHFVEIWVVYSALLIIAMHTKPMKLVEKWL